MLKREEKREKNTSTTTLNSIPSADREKYSRQIKLFGEETQEKIRNTLVVIITLNTSSISELISRIIEQMGGKVKEILVCCSDSNSNTTEKILQEYEYTPTTSNTSTTPFYYIVIDGTCDLTVITDRVFYIDTVKLVLSKHLLSHSDAGSIDTSSYTTSLYAQLPPPIYIEYLNILAGITVQEYIKVLHGISKLDTWRVGDWFGSE